ncbi:glycosyl transferase, partial [Klebsiella pneumoniae]|nr:glycosyl transferase [Klebsiella pneumoniae]
KYTIVGNWNHSDYARTLRLRHSHEPRLRFLDPIYDPLKLAELRAGCEFYLHGHSVGGTNTSLVEMLFYDCSILCFDVDFHRRTAGGEASYFASAKDLQRAL